MADASLPARLARAAVVAVAGLVFAAGAWSQAASAPSEPAPAAVPAAGMVQLIAPKAVPTAADPALEARMLAITAELRCLVCQNQTIADSHADLAVDLRQQVREMIKAGRTDAQIRQFMTDRYGDFVLYNPPLKPTTLVLWLGPALLLVVALIALMVVIARRGRLADDRFEPDPDWSEDDPAGDDAGPSVCHPQDIARPGAPA